eukprot:1145878-Pelagomonas_calceolata.AAC.5
MEGIHGASALGILFPLLLWGVFFTAHATDFVTNVLLEEKNRQEKYTPARRLHALRKGSLTSKLARVSPKGSQT